MPIDVSYPTPLLEDIFADAKPVVICAEQSVLHNIKGIISQGFSLKFLISGY